ncbi:MFS transporter [Candidatus Woesebacteria bacterium]|nr:MFS transporter [Candidatus Woesebacteria bacterium]
MSLKGNVKKYYAFNFFNSLEFFAPVIVLFWQSKGLNFSQIMVLQSIYAIGVIVLELPTGALADYLGKRISLILGSLFFTAGFLIYGISSEFWHFVIGELTIGTGAALISGADSAFIHESLNAIGKGSEYKRTEGSVRGLTSLSRAVGKIVGGLLGSISLSYTLLATAVATFAGFITSTTFSETKENQPRDEKTTYFQIIKDSLKIVLKSKPILWLVLFFASFNALIWSTNWFSQPYLQMLNIPVVYFGVIFASFNIVTAIGSSRIEAIEKIVKRPFIVMGVLAIVSLFLLGSFPSIYLFPLWAFFNLFLVLNQTFVTHKVLSFVPENRAATVLSFMNLIRRFIYAGFGPVLGIIGDKFGLLSALQFNSVVLLIVLLVLFVLRKRWLVSETAW